MLDSDAMKLPVLVISVPLRVIERPVPTRIQAMLHIRPLVDIQKHLR
jgi:hypothetical protein